MKGEFLFLIFASLKKKLEERSKIFPGERNSFERQTSIQRR